MGCDLCPHPTSGRTVYFYSHIPCGMWRGTSPSKMSDNDFYSHIPCGMWQNLPRFSVHHRQFLLTHPVWDVTKTNVPTDIMYKNFYSHIPCGMWRKVPWRAIWEDYISTHTSRVGCDAFYLNVLFALMYFYSHIPCGMWRPRSSVVFPRFEFLLTHPVWDVTSIRYASTTSIIISTHTSRVGCDGSHRFV